VVVSGASRPKSGKKKLGRDIPKLGGVTLEGIEPVRGEKDRPLKDVPGRGYELIPAKLLPDQGKIEGRKSKVSALGINTTSPLLKEKSGSASASL